MSSLKKRVSTYLRQLSFHNEPRERLTAFDENSFILKYLNGHVALKEGPQVHHGKVPADLPSLELGSYQTGHDSIVGCYTGPNTGITTVQKIEKHLSVADLDIEFIDTEDESVRQVGISNNAPLKRASRELSQSLTRLVDKENLVANNNRGDVEVAESGSADGKRNADNVNRCLAKSKSEGNPFHHKRGRVVRLAQRPQMTDGTCTSASEATASAKLPYQWNRPGDLVYGTADSLYDRNQILNVKNGDPIADCFGIIARRDSSIVALADGVNWGQKARIAARSAVYGSLRYLNEIVFCDKQLFARSQEEYEARGGSLRPAGGRTTHTTTDVFVCLLRAFNCGHDLILENEGMLTTLTVAVVLPLKRQEERQQYVCCVCNVGDTLAYVYSQQHGVREITKGSHDVNTNRDIRDALGALGPVEGTNPELSNLTLSMTLVEAGDIVFVASDGLTDNYDPTICRFAVNAEKTGKQAKAAAAAAAASSSSTSSASSRKAVPLQKSHSARMEHLRLQPMKSSSGTALALKGAAEGQHRSGNFKPNFLRSKTNLEGRSKVVCRNADGLPYITPVQKYELSLLLMEDILRKGLSGRERRCSTARQLCDNLVRFTFSMTSAKRCTLEDDDLYYDNKNGVLLELSAAERKLRRRKYLEKTQHLPGKLDHVSVAAYNVGQVTVT